MENKGAILFGMFGILVFVFLGFIYFLNSNTQQNNIDQKGSSLFIVGNLIDNRYLEL
jgi:hypothetical protein